MPRAAIIPQKQVIEEIKSLEEIPPHGDEPGLVRVLVGLVDENGAFIVPQRFQAYEIDGAAYDELTGPPAEWAPDKPAGTYRNADVWRFIDLLRA